MTVPIDRLAKAFVEVAETTVDEFDTVEFLQLRLARTAELLDGSHMGLLLATEAGQLEFATASDESIRSRCSARRVPAWTRVAGLVVADLASVPDLAGA